MILSRIFKHWILSDAFLYYPLLVSKKSLIFVVPNHRSVCSPVGPRLTAQYEIGPFLCPSWPYYYGMLYEIAAAYPG